MTRIPLATDYKTRTGVPDKDARLKNAYTETRGEQSVVRRRPSGQGGIAVGTGTAQGGIGFNIAGTDYFIGFWADTMQTATSSSLANGGQYGYSSTLTYAVDDFVDYVPSPPSDPFADPPLATRYYCYGPSTNKAPATNPNLWSVTPPPATRYYAIGSGYDGVSRTTGSCATPIASIQALFNMMTKTSCTAPYPPQTLWLMEPLSVVGLQGYAHGWGTTDTPPYDVCPGLDGGLIAFGTITQTA